ASNEPDNAKGDGGTVDDIVIVNDFTFNLRAERSGGGSSRTYTITYQATDSSGNTAQASITVEVPHNK
ncbi:MAG: VWA domain-containing protein, partial [Candidatus Bathyarchaeota archaeon]